MAADAYTRTAVILHWAIALLVFIALPMGVYMQDLPLSPEKIRLVNYHKWIGVGVFALACLRAAWRFTHKPPELPAHMQPWERLAAMLVHYLLYALIFAIPLSGWVMSSALGLQTVWFGVLPIPDLVGRDKVLGEYFLTVHQGLNATLAILLLGHIGAALKHHFIDRDEVLRHMVRWRRA